MISILLTVRKNSKFFAKWLIAYLKHTRNFNNIELLILCSKEDEWNKDYFDYYKLNVEYEDWNCGKNGRHLFYNHLAKKAKSDWVWHMCDDHYLLDGYDEYLVNYIKEKQIDGNKINCIVPMVQNSGSISHILSRGWINKTGRIGFHGNIDSYINDVLALILKEDRIYHPEQAVLWDYTTDPTIMTPAHSDIILNPNYVFYDFFDPIIREEINKDATLLYTGIMEEE